MVGHDSGDRALMSRHTQEEIAEAMGMPRTTIEDILTKMARLRFPSKPGEWEEEGKTDEQLC